MTNLTAMKRQAERAYAHILGSGMKREAKIFEHAAIQLIEHDNPQFFEAIGRMKRTPVTIEEFIESNDFLGGAGFEIWPALAADLRTMCPDVMIGEEPVHEALLGGATGTGKTHLSTACLMYQIYLLTCFEQPQRLFNLTPATKIVFMLQSVSQTVTKRVIYTPMRAAFTSMPYVRKYVPYDRYKEASLVMDCNIEVVPALANLQAILGQAVCGCLLDEVNFMAIVENSKLVPGLNGLGGKYDQAEQVYYNISRRRKRSFTTKGVSIGTLCIVSSTRYKGDFLDRRIAEVRKHEEPNILTFRRKQYEVNPRFTDGKFDTFRIAVGSDESPTVVIEDGMEPGVHFPASATILEIPDPYKPDFKKDPDAALRDVVGIATDAITPFIRKRQKIVDAVARGKDRSLKSWVNKTEVNLADDGFPMWEADNMPKKAIIKDRPRWVHVDLSKNKDRCGIAVVSLDGWVNVPQKDNPDTIEVLPKFTVEAAVAIQPSAIAEIDPSEVRGWIMQLSTLYGLNIDSVTFDGFQSVESIAVLRKAGVRSRLVSVDRGTEPYEALRDCIYQDRLDIQPDCDMLRAELVTLEYYPEKDKIDHPPRGSKDVADAVCGAVYAALKSRQVRTGTEPTNNETGERTRVRKKRVRARTRTRRS